MKFITRFIGKTLILALPSVMLLGGYAYHINAMSNAQKQANLLLMAEVALLDEQVKQVRNLQRVRESLLTRYTIVSELEDNESHLVNIVGTIADLDDGVFLELVKMEDNLITIRGRAKDLSSLLQVIRKFELVGIEFTNRDGLDQGLIGRNFMLKGNLAGSSNETD